MPNWCEYEMKVVAKDHKAIDRLLSIMNYRDSEFYLYRVASARMSVFDNTYPNVCSAIIEGDVAWSTNYWTSPRKEDDIASDTGARLARLQDICEKLDIAVEIFSREPGIGFQTHEVINNLGEIELDECVDWTEEYEDLDGVLHEEAGGFADFGEYCGANELYKERD